MDAKSFYKKIQNNANLTDELSARRAAKTVLQTLHWRLMESEADDIEATLPPEIKKIWKGNFAMVISKKSGGIKKFNKKQFISQIKTRSRLQSLAEAERVANAVLSVLKEAIPAGETTDMLAQLPNDLRDFIKAA